MSVGFPTWVNFRMIIRQDTHRIRYPIFKNDPSLRAVDISSVKKHGGCSLGVRTFRSSIEGDDGIYVYKCVERDFYEPRDSEVLEKEFENLQMFRGSKAIVQLVASVISPNPYSTYYADGSLTVLRGFLIDYHSNGTLSEALQSPGLYQNQFLGWAVEISRGVSCLHHRGVAHMDLKPTNIVLSKEWKPVIIDISGVEGVSREWLSPEMRDKDDPCSESLDARKKNDIWTLGKIFLEMVAGMKEGSEKALLQSVAYAAMAQHLSLDCLQHRLEPDL